MYNNNIVNSQESTTILNACTKKSLKTNWRHLVYIYVDFVKLPFVYNIKYYIRYNLQIDNKNWKSKIISKKMK